MSADDGAARAADRRRERDARRYRREHRNDPLPPMVWIVEHDGTYGALRVTAPGRADIWRGGSTNPQPVRVVAFTRGRIRRRLVRLVCAGGSATQVRMLAFGERGMADVGRPVVTVGDAGVTDLLDVALLLLMLLIATPRAIARRAARSRAVEELRVALAL